jgi:hypothetical protein
MDQALLELLLRTTRNALFYLAYEELSIKRGINITSYRKSRKPDLVCLVYRELTTSVIHYNVEDIYNTYKGIYFKF